MLARCNSDKNVLLGEPVRWPKKRHGKYFVPAFSAPGTGTGSGSETSSGNAPTFPSPSDVPRLDLLYHPRMAYALVVLGILLLGVGASWMVDGASRLALRLGLSPMVVGLTVVGFGTSMPEFMVSVLAAGRGSGGLSIGNAVGSNVMNLLLVLGVAAVLAPVRVVGRSHELRRNLLFGLAPAVVLIIGAWNGAIGRLEAALLLVLFGLFFSVTLLDARRTREAKPEASGGLGRPALLTLLGIVVLSAGAESLVRGGTSLARSFGISEAIIGLTLVAFGTSLPELAASVAAAVKGQTDMSIGNVLGSNVFNLGLIVGTAFMVRPGVVPYDVIRFDLPYLAVVTVFLGFGMLRDGKISRREGAVLLALFSAYLVTILYRAI